MKKEIEIVDTTPEDKDQLAELRLVSMRESLEALGRFDPETARLRFTRSFDPDNTKKILLGGEMVGFYVLVKKPDHFQLDHFYIHPDQQGHGIGAHVMGVIIDLAKASNLPIRLGALKGSRSNEFYQSHGFKPTHKEQWDNYYELAF